MGITMRGSFIRVSVMAVEFTITLLMEDMRVIGLMGDMMGMGLRAGLKEANIEGNIEVD